MQDALLTFAHGGDPATSTLPWPTYHPPKRATMIFDRPTAIQDAPREAERRFWEEVRWG
jgi:para-nitrobenzyl esterase